MDRTIKMNQADEIRKYVKEFFIEPARKKGLKEITIKAGDVDRGMRLGRVANVNSVLGGKQLQEMCEIKLIKKNGNTKSTTGTYTYILSPSDNVIAVVATENVGNTATETSAVTYIRDKPKEPQFKFEFIVDEEMKNLLIKDWIEAEKAFNYELYKSTMVLCGAILEALLRDALYLKEKVKVKFIPPIKDVQFHQLIDFAEQQGIIKHDVAKLSHNVRDYRNLIHLQKKELNVNKETANIIVSLLKLAYENISAWHTKNRAVR